MTIIGRKISIVSYQIYTLNTPIPKSIDNSKRFLFRGKS